MFNFFLDDSNKDKNARNVNFEKLLNSDNSAQNRKLDNVKNTDVENKGNVL